MKLCLVVRAGKVVEVTMVSDNHVFGAHGDHVHLDGTLVDQHACLDGIIDRKVKTERGTKR